MPNWISPQGIRQSVPHAVLYPLLESNATCLRVITEWAVLRVLFDDGKQATGVEVVQKSGEATDAPSATITIKARKQVVLSAGAFGSPMILERSGIGSPTLLGEHGIPLISAVEGVGINYRDHNMVTFPYKSTAKPEEGLDDLFTGKLSTEGTPTTNPVLGWNGLEVGGKIRPSEADVETFDGDLRESWERDFKTQTERPLLLLQMGPFFLGDHSNLPSGQQYFTMCAASAYPYSRGSVHISGPSIHDEPDFRAGFLTHKSDLGMLVWGYKKTREIARRMVRYAGVFEHGHPVFKDGSAAEYAKDYETIQQKSKVELDDILYDRDDEDAIKECVREQAKTLWHSMGTCAMKPFADGGVLDAELNVYGVKGLKVAGESSLKTYATSKLISLH